MYTPRISVEAISNASIHHSALQNRNFGHTYDRSRALIRAIGVKAHAGPLTASANVQYDRIVLKF
jgi:hypothetical protein